MLDGMLDPFKSALTVVNYSLGLNIIDQFLKLSKIGFPLKFFKADFQNCQFGRSAGNLPLKDSRDLYESSELP